MKIVTFSFDDGTVQDRRLVRLLDQYGMKATFNLCSNEWGRKHRINHLGINCDHSELRRKDAAVLYKNHEVACHTKTHPDNLDELPADRLVWEIEQNRTELEALTGKSVTGFAYPYGKYNDAIISAIRRQTGIRYARTTECTFQFGFSKDFFKWRPTCRATDERFLELTDAFLGLPDDGFQLLFVFGHSFEFDKFEGAWGRFELALKKLAGDETIVRLTSGQAMRQYLANHPGNAAQD